MEALVLAVAVLAAEAPAPAPRPGGEAAEAPKPKVEAAEAPKPKVEAGEPGAAKVEAAEPPKPKMKLKVEKKLPPVAPRKRPEAPPRPKPYFISASCGVSFPFSGGKTIRPTKLRFEWPAFEAGIECGMDMPNAEVRLSFDSRTYKIEYVGGNWICDRLFVCGGWRAPFLETLEFVIGGGVGVIYNSAGRVWDDPKQAIHEDPEVFAVRLYSCLRYRPDWPVEFELYGRLTFAEADYDLLGYSSTQDLSAGEFGFAVRARF